MQPPKESVYLIIPVHNRKAITLSCLDHLYTQGDAHRYHIVVVDDGSTDGTAEAIQQHYPDVTVLSGNGDLWWTGATALGMQYAYQQGATYFFWLNDDCLPLPGTLPGLVQFMENHPNTLVGPACYANTVNPKTLQNSGFCGRYSYKGQPGEVRWVEGLSGWCAGIPVSVVEAIGFPDANRFPHYIGDTMYSLKAVRRGFKACLVGDLPVVLTGLMEVAYDLQDYFQPELSPIASFQAIFWSKKSLYRIPSKFFCFIDRQGLFVGSCLFSIKLMSWLSQWTALQIRARFKPKTWRKANT